MTLTELINALFEKDLLSDRDLEKACLCCFQLLSNTRPMMRIEKEIIELCDFERG
jgi:hypothetical protein